MSQFFSRVAFLFLFMGAILSSVSRADTPAAKPVLIFLVNHGFTLDEPSKRAALSDELISDMSQKMEKAGVPKDRPVALWVESAVPARLIFSLEDPERFYDKLSNESGLSMEQITEALLQPRWGTDARSKKLYDIMLAVYKGDKKKKPAAAAVIKDGEAHLKNDMPKDAMGEKLGKWAEESKKYNFTGYKLEKAPFDAWIAVLRSRQWEYASYEAFQKRGMEKALKLALYENIQKKRSMVLRDQKLAKDIAAWHKKRPRMLNVVLRGASHEYLAPQLKALGLENEVFRDAKMTDVLTIAEIYTQYTPTDKVYEKKYFLNGLERRAMTRAFLERLCWYHLIEAKKMEFNFEFSKKLCTAIRSLSDLKLQQWLDMMKHQPPELPLEKDASLSWSWFAKAVDFKIDV